MGEPGATNEWTWYYLSYWSDGYFIQLVIITTCLLAMLLDVIQLNSGVSLWKCFKFFNYNKGSNIYDISQPYLHVSVYNTSGLNVNGF